MKQMVGMIVMNIVFGLFCLLAAVPAYAGSTVSFAWDANQEVDLAGYRLYQTTTPGAYSSPHVAEIPVGTETVTLSDVPDGTWFWVLTAFDSFNNESGPSNEVTKSIDTEAPTAPCLLRFVN